MTKKEIKELVHKALEGKETTMANMTDDCDWEGIGEYLRMAGIGINFFELRNGGIFCCYFSHKLMKNIILDFDVVANFPSNVELEDYIMGLLNSAFVIENGKENDEGDDDSDCIPF